MVSAHLAVSAFGLLHIASRITEKNFSIFNKVKPLILGTKQIF